MNDCTDVPAEDVSCATFNVEMKKQNHVAIVAGFLLEISGECSKPFSKKVLDFLHSSLLESSEYTNELPTLTECKKES